MTMDDAMITDDIITGMFLINIVSACVCLILELIARLFCDFCDKLKLPILCFLNQL